MLYEASSGHSPVNKRDRSPRYSSHHHRHHSRSYHTSQRHREADSTSQSSKYHQTQHTESSNRTSSTHAGHSSDIIASHSKKTVRSKGDWSEHMSSSGRKYYYNCKTEVSKWEKPKDWTEDDPKSSRLNTDSERRKDTSSHHSTGFNHTTSKNGSTDPQLSSSSKLPNTDEYPVKKNYMSDHSAPDFNEPHHKQSTIHELVSPEEDDDGFNTEVSIQNKEDHDSRASIQSPSQSRRKSQGILLESERTGNSSMNSSPKDINAIVKNSLRLKSNSSNFSLKTDTINLPPSLGTKQYKTIITSLEVDIPLINHTIQPPPTTVNEESRHSRNANPEGGIYYNQAEHIANDMLSRSCSDAIKSKFEIFHARTYLNIARYKVECHDLRSVHTSKEVLLL
ncbi:WW domain-containing adapter protein with coiled-coil [Trichoplax sp. H2]|nr:WW domain-containing adapter protein with coiled-coil [Trichoplax sp. H2]|eukprot:RDD41037.1 WW domain-containing adapter protein with coiled-coil [Trichoplax sp. H2]